MDDRDVEPGCHDELRELAVALVALYDATYPDGLTVGPLDPATRVHQAVARVRLRTGLPSA
ncbi:hypothetical protein [Actinotalea sp. JY-7876]|uniref:hypothetical protein n=1 Tax=Actinotalea sp. JY-7876 TaxID=2758442 RepID=UPI0015F4A364|nr:hypothetical protein [Actinotalea sp. JY-7876]